MGQNWRLGDFDETAPFLPERDEVETPKSGKDVHRLMLEAARRTVGLQAEAGIDPGVSPVESAMQRNAPDLVGATKAKLAAKRAEEELLGHRRWPRSRLLSLVMVATLAALMPTEVMRLLLWSLIMVMVAAVAIGPERVRDGLRSVGMWCLGYWRHELRLAHRLISGGN